MVDGVHLHAFQRRRDRRALPSVEHLQQRRRRRLPDPRSLVARARDNGAVSIEHNCRRAGRQDLALDDLQHCFRPQHRREHVRNRVALADRQPDREDVHVQHLAPDQVADAGHARAHRRLDCAGIDRSRQRRAQRQAHIDHVLRSRIGQNDVRPRRTSLEQCARLRVEAAEVARPQARARGQRVQRGKRRPQLCIHGCNDRAHRVLGGLDLLPPLGLGVVEECDERQQHQRQQAGNDYPEQPLLERTERDGSPQTLHVHLRVF